MNKRDYMPEMSIREFMDIEHKASSYIIPRNFELKDLVEAYSADFDNSYSVYRDADWYERSKMIFTLMFIFECGRIFGIRMERGKRRKGAAHEEV